MRSICKSICAALFLLGTIAPAQQRYNVVTQLNWVPSTGHGAPTAACDSTNYGQPYTDLDAQLYYACGTSGWIKVSGSTSPLQFTGPWSSVVTYTATPVAQAAFYSGSWYVSLQNGNINQNPATATTYWSLLFSGGGGGAVSSFNARTGAVTLSAADVDGVGPITNNTSGNAATATTATNATNAANATAAAALSGTPTQCPGGQFAQGIAANGNAQGCATSGGAVSSVNGQTGAVTITPQNIGAQPNTAIVAGATADYTFEEGSGTALIDQTGNGHNGTLVAGHLPTWLPTGLAFSIGATSGVQLPTALNSSRTIFLAAYVNPFGTFGPADSITNPYVSIVTSSKSSTAPPTGLNLMMVAADVASSNFITGAFAPSTYSDDFGGPGTQCGVILAGFHVFAYILNTNPTLDQLFIDGTECPYTASHHSSAGVQTSGNLYLGSANVGLWATNGFGGNIYRAIFYTAALTVPQVQSMSGLIANQVGQRGVATAPVNLLLKSPQIHCVGDSITWGQGAATNWCANLTLTRQPTYNIVNWGVPSALLQDETGSDPNRVGQQCITASGPAVAVVFSGTNDFLGGGGTGYAPTVVSLYAGEVQTLKKAGCQVLVATMLSRNQSGSLDLDPEKNAFDELLLSQAKALGADGIVDFAADPNLGADGAYASTTWFVDDTHPTTAGQVRLGQIASNSLNYFYGYTAAQPHVVTTNTYTLASGDDFLTAAPTAAAAYTMPDCTGPSGGVYIISNPQSAFTLTVQGGASQPINGLTSAITIPSNSTVKLTDVPNPKTTSGCHWSM